MTKLQRFFRICNFEKHRSASVHFCMEGLQLPKRDPWCFWLTAHHGRSIHYYKPSLHLAKTEEKSSQFQSDSKPNVLICNTPIWTSRRTTAGVMKK